MIYTFFESDLIYKPFLFLSVTSSLFTLHSSLFTLHFLPLNYFHFFHNFPIDNPREIRYNLIMKILSFLTKFII